MTLKNGDIVIHISRPELTAKLVYYGPCCSYISYGTKDNPIYPRGDDLDKSSSKHGCMIVNTELIKPASLAAALQVLK